MSSANNRASLLSGLRTGGVRPQTAALGGSFQPPRFTSGLHQSTLYENVAENSSGYEYGNMPMTAALDGRAPRFQQQQQQQYEQQFLMQQAQLSAVNGVPNGLLNAMDPVQSQFLQLQLMQAMVMQQQQAQKLQAELALQHQVAMAINNQRQQQSARLASTASRMPTTSGPTQTTFDINLAPSNYERTPAIEETNYGAAPMTAALGGKFGSRNLASGLNPNAATFKLGADSADVSANSLVPPPTPSSTVVISGGVSLGGPSAPTAAINGPSKSDSATSWRRPSNAATQPRSLSPPKTVGRQSPPSVELSSPESTGKYSPPQASSVPKYRPQALRIRELEKAMGNIEIEQGPSGYGGRGQVKPPSPTSSSSSYEDQRKPLPLVRQSQPLRQPRGPPAGAEELTVKNFATRGKRTASNPLVIGQMATFVEAY
ncbi:hypothetical protein FS842_010373 [Serendipita sp. 407]|nr:hypothetical protein FS842_010373 [Serendipita sp. 407]